jgi:hypothetical protein
LAWSLPVTLPDFDTIGKILAVVARFRAPRAAYPLQAPPLLYIGF